MLITLFNYLQVKGDSTHFCSTYACEMVKYLGVGAGQVASQYFDCNGREDCRNTVADEQQDCRADEALYQCKDTDTGQSIPTWKLCDNNCDCRLCDDESFCNNVQYGAMCERKYGEYIPPIWICDRIKYCYDGTDESNCTTNKSCTISPTHQQYQYFKNENGIRQLRRDQICTVPLQNSICSDGLDQTNCSDTERVAMSCTLAGYPTNISIFGMCEGYPLCDDDYNNKCLEPEGGCIIHKTALCDGVPDCPGGADETKTSCGILSNSVNCVRRVAKKRAKGLKLTYSIPLNWVFDNEIDCLNGEDENRKYWKKCGSGLSVRYLDKGSTCSDQMKCPNDDKFVDFEELCDKIETCGKENQICRISRGTQSTWDTMVSLPGKHSIKGSPICSQGLKNLQYQTGKCHGLEMSNKRTSHVYFTKTSTDLTLLKSRIDCRFIYGENYVYHSCTDSCQPTTSCPLKTIPHDTCVNKVDKRVFAITVSNELTVVLKRSQVSEDGSGKVVEYHNELYPCNNKNCVMYSQVCNLVDDCGDGSDEVNCTNHFLCNVSKEYIPLSSKCDGHVDCRDYHDECNSDCDSSDKFILRNSFLRSMSWSVGSLATLFNSFNIVSSAYYIRQVDTFGGLMNKCLILLISFGDFLMGVYLVLIAYADLHFGNLYCQERYVWLSSTECSFLGILSTIGTQVSLFSMTALSIFRIKTVSMIIQRSISVRSIMEMVLIILTILALSAAVAFVPVITVLEDFFVNGLYYHQHPLFTGSVTKTNHYEIFRGYYGYFKSSGLSWTTIQFIVADMFTSDYGGESKTFDLSSFSMHPEWIL